MLNDLVSVLKAVGKEVELLAMPDGTRVLLLPYGGRVLGLYSAASDCNFFWTNPALDSEASARAFYTGNEWQNSGGDRTWLSPEVDLFFPDFPDQSRYWQPRALDPGQYALQPYGDTVRLVNRLSLAVARARCTVELEITKHLEPAPNPLGRSELAADGAIQYAGYTQHTTLQFRERPASASVRIGLWDLMQMPHGGELLVAAYGCTEPKVYFGAIGPEDLAASNGLVRYRMRAHGEHKIGLRAAAMTGRAGYWYPGGDEITLIIRNFFVNPSGEYVDVPWSDFADTGYAVQACNVNSALGKFSELEYHVPAIGGGSGPGCSADVSQVWAFRGPHEAIRAIAHQLLSPLA
jgi:hypothetical protein